MSTETIEPDQQDGQATGHPDAHESTEVQQKAEDTGDTLSPDPMGENPEAERRLTLYENHVAALQKQHEKVGRLRGEHEARKDEAKRAKEALEAALDELDRMAGEDPSYGPLFEAGQDAGPEVWREVRISMLVEHGATAGTIESIGKHLSPDTGSKGDDYGATLSALSDLIGRGHGWWNNVAGVGQAKAEKVQEALQAWFRANPELCRQPEGDEDDDASPEAAE